MQDNTPHNNQFSATDNRLSPGLGWVTAVVGLVASLVPLIIKWTKGDPQDVWSGFSSSEKIQYVNEAIVVAKEAVRQGQANTIEQSVQVLIAQVELDESWDEWKSKNQSLVVLINQAQLDIESEQKNSLASLGSGNIVLWALLFSVLGYGFYKYRKNKQIVSQKLTVKNLAK